MSTEDRTRWDRRYADGSYTSRPNASPFVVEWLERIQPRPGATALDVACGLGRNSRHLAHLGLDVTGWDISTIALTKARSIARKEGLSIRFEPVDVDVVAPAVGEYEVIVVARFINRTLNKTLPAALAPGGWLIYEHHLQTDSDVGGPSDPDFRFRINELLKMCESLRVVFYEETIDVDPDGRTMALARVAACNDLPRGI